MQATSKLIAVMDRCTRIPIIAFKLYPESAEEFVMFKTHGFGDNPEQYTFFYDIVSGKCSYNAYGMGDSYTLTPACVHIRDHWDEVESGTVIDAEYLRGETTHPRTWEGEYL